MRRTRATLLRSTARGPQRVASGTSTLVPPDIVLPRDFLRQDAEAHTRAADVDGPSDEAAAEVEDELAWRRIVLLKWHIERAGETALGRGHTGNVECPLVGS